VHHGKECGWCKWTFSSPGGNWSTMSNDRSKHIVTRTDETRPTSTQKEPLSLMGDRNSIDSPRKKDRERSTTEKEELRRTEGGQPQSKDRPRHGRERHHLPPNRNFENPHPDRIITSEDDEALLGKGERVRHHWGFNSSRVKEPRAVFDCSRNRESPPVYKPIIGNKTTRGRAVPKSVSQKDRPAVKGSMYGSGTNHHFPRSLSMDTSAPRAKSLK